MNLEVPVLIGDLVELGGAGLQVIELDKPVGPVTVGGAVLLGVHRAGPIPESGLDAFDILISADFRAPRPWVIVRREHLDGAIDALRGRIMAQPVAATIAAQVFRMTLELSFARALALESLAYSTLLASSGFQNWRKATPVRFRDDDAPRVVIEELHDSLHIRLTRPATRNAFDAPMRDELVEALAFALEHPDQPNVVLSGEGPDFSAGGDLDTFGQAADVGEAHLIRMLRSPARLAHDLGERLIVHMHGACVGAGIEIPAAASRITARAGTVFRLPEVAMGLIPGAGGTASISRRIGRRRACYLTLSGDNLGVETALAWGLIDEVLP